MCPIDGDSKPEHQQLSAKEKISKLKQESCYNVLILQYGIDNLGTDDPEKRRTAKEKVYFAIDKFKNKTDPQEIIQHFDTFLQQEQTQDNPRQIAKIGDLIAAYDALFVREYGEEKSWLHHDEEKNILKIYLDAKGINTNEAAVADRMEKNAIRYKELTQDLELAKLPDKQMSPDALRLSILENYIKESGKPASPDTQTEIRILKGRIKGYFAGDEIKQQIIASNEVNIPHTGGIPNFLFEGNPDTYPVVVTRSKSGRLIEASRDTAGILVRDVLRNEFKIALTKIDDETLVGTFKTAQFGPDESPHPDFRAKESAHRAFLFMVEQGNKIKHFTANWPESGPLTTNRSRFEQALVENGVVDKLENVVEFLKNMDWNTLDDAQRNLISKSAFTTWTGKLVSGMGFNEVTDMRVVSNGHLLVAFSRDTPLTAQDIPITLSQNLEPQKNTS
jgi:hypothetical protein